jgi:type I restriction enzyme, S subunit
MKEGWHFKQLAAVSAIKYGYTISASSEPVGPRFLRITDIQNDHVDWASVPYCKISSADASKYRLASGDIVFARTGATTGKSFLVNDSPDAVFASYLIRLRLLDKNLLPEFVSLFFQTDDYWKSIKDGSTGSAQGGFNATKLGSISIPFPSIVEQKRIITVLNEAFESIATAKANTEKNRQNASDLFDSYLQEVFFQRGKGWEKQTLASLCALFVDSAHRTPKYAEEGIPALRPRDVVNGKLNLAGALRVSEEEFEVQSKRYKPSPGDIVYSRELSYGWAAILPESSRVCLSQGMCVFRPSSKLDASFLLYVLNSSVGREQAVRAAVGTAHPHINLGDIKSYLIPLPPLAEQKQITRRLDALTEETQRLASACERKLIALEALKKSLLHQAFSGELPVASMAEAAE